MVKGREHDPFSLFSFAMRESDWVLADLIACYLVSDETSHVRLAHEIKRNSNRPGAPGSLSSLHRWARLSRGLEED